MVSRPPTEEELVERAKRGDEDAYEELVRAHQGIAFRTAYLVAGSAAEAEDAAQEGFVKAYRALLAFRDRDGQFRENTARLAGKTLLWQLGDVTLRLEGELSKEEALRIARSAG